MLLIGIQKMQRTSGINQNNKQPNYKWAKAMRRKLTEEILCSLASNQDNARLNHNNTPFHQRSMYLS